MPERGSDLTPLDAVFSAAGSVLRMFLRIFQT